MDSYPQDSQRQYVVPFGIVAGSQWEPLICWAMLSARDPIPFFGVGVLVLIASPDGGSVVRCATTGPVLLTGVTTLRSSSS